MSGTQPSYHKLTFLIVNDSVTLKDTNAIAVAKNFLTPRDGRLLSRRSGTEAVNNSLAFSIQSVVSVLNLDQRLPARANDIQILNTKVSLVKREIRALKRENRELQGLVIVYSNDMRIQFDELQNSGDRIREDH